MARAFRAIFAAVILSVSWAAPATTEPYSDKWQAASEAMKRNDYATALKLFRSLAEQGYPDAQFQLGFLYRTGWGVPKENSEAFRWFERAADQGHVYARSNLGFMYRDGEGVQQDFVQAHKWFKLASASPGEPLRYAREYLDSVEKKMTPAQIAEVARVEAEAVERPKMNTVQNRTHS
jgi:hypothetical protein